MTEATMHLTRDVFGPTDTLGVLRWKGLDFGFVAEDQDRGIDQAMSLEEIKALKVASKTAIPTGLYIVKTTWSPKYRRMMPLVMNVPGFEGIRVHSGNTAKDSAGCLLPGMARDIERYTVSRSRVACQWLYREIAAMEADGEEVTLLIDRKA